MYSAKSLDEMLKERDARDIAEYMKYKRISGRYWTIKFLLCNEFLLESFETSQQSLYITTTSFAHI